MINKLSPSNKIFSVIALASVAAFVFGVAAITAPAPACALTIPTTCPNFGLERTTTYNLQDTAYAYGYGVAAVDASKDVYVVGEQYAPATGLDAYLIKYDAAGAMQWGGPKIYDAGGNESAYGVAVASNGDVYMVGRQTDASGMNSDIFVRKYDGAGNAVWTTTYDGGYTDVARGVAVDAAGNAYVTGYRQNAAGDVDMLFLSYDPNGAMRGGFPIAYSGAAGMNESGYGITVSGNDVYITGYVQPQAGVNNTDAALWRYNTSGGLAWVQAYNSGGDQTDIGYGVTVDSSGNPHMTGYQDTKGGDMFVRKYTAAGALTWSDVYNSGTNQNDTGRSVVTGTSGRIFVAGRQQTHSEDAYLREYYPGVINIPFSVPQVCIERLVGIVYETNVTASGTIGRIYVMGTDATGKNWGSSCGGDPGYWNESVGKKLAYEFNWNDLPVEFSSITVSVGAPPFTYVISRNTPNNTRYANVAITNECTGSGLIYTVPDGCIDDSGSGGSGDTLEVYCFNGVAKWCLSHQSCFWRGQTTDSQANLTCDYDGLSGTRNGVPSPMAWSNGGCGVGSGGLWQDANGIPYYEYFCSPVQQRFGFLPVSGSVTVDPPTFIYKGDQGGAPEYAEIGYSAAITDSSVPAYAGIANDVYVTGYQSSNGGEMFLNKYSCNATSKTAFSASFSANFSVTPQTGTAPLTVKADARASAGSIVSYNWDWGDGTTKNNASAVEMHAYASAGSYIITLTVKDSKGVTSNATETVTVNPNNAPVAGFTVTPSTGAAPLIVTVDGASSTDPDMLQGGYIQSFTWDWGDKTVSGSGQKTRHTYTAQGTYTITLTVTDNGGMTNATTQTVTVTAQYVCTPSCTAPTGVCGPGPTAGATQCYACLENADCGTGYRCLGTACKQGDVCPGNTLCPADGKCPEAITCNPLAAGATCPDGSACPASGVCPAQKYACVLSSSAVDAQCYVEEFGGCLVDNDCKGSLTGGVCNTATNTCRYARCVNTTDRACTKDSQCTSGDGTCNAGVCNYVYDCGYGPGMGKGASGLYLTTAADPMPAMPLGVQPDGQACTKPTPDAPNNCEGINGCLYYNYNTDGTPIQSSDNSVGTCINTFEGGTGCVYYQYYDGATQTTRVNCLPRYSENTKKAPNAGIPAGCFVVDKGKAGKEYDCSAVNGCYYYLDGRMDCTYNNITATACTSSADCTAEPLAIGVCNAATNLCEYHGNGCLYEPNPKGAIACPGTNKAATGGNNFVQCLLDKDAGLPGFLLGAANKLLSSCNTAADCPSGDVCVNGTCYPQCQGAVDCTTGQSCTTTCTTSLNCTGGLVCIGGMCVPPTSCTPGTICPSGVICPITGICPPPISCTPGTICPSGAMCPVSGICPPATSCTPGTLCPSGALCPINGVCPPPASCTPGTLCPSGAICPVNGICPPSTMCIPGTVCPSGALCPANGICPPSGSCTPGSVCPSGALCPVNGICPPAGTSCTPGTICPSGFVCPVNGVCSCPVGTVYDASSGTCVDCTTNSSLPGCPIIAAFCLQNPGSALCKPPSGGITTTPGTASCNTLGYTFTGTAVMPSGNCDLVAIILALLSWLAWIIALLAVLSGLRAAYLYITSMGDERKLILARRYLIYTTIGVGVAVLSFSIVAIARAILNI